MNRKKGKKTAEQRLIDANNVETGFYELCKSPYFKNDVSAKHGAETLMDLCIRTDSHKQNTIDPEALPIVLELRDNLAKVTAERDAAMSFIPKNCATCKYGASPCDWCVNTPDGGLNWEWNGKSKE